MPSNGELVSALETSPESPLPRENRAIAPGKEGAPLRDAKKRSSGEELARAASPPVVEIT
jgi:hypothetical protein